MDNNQEWKGDNSIDFDTFFKTDLYREDFKKVQLILIDEAVVLAELCNLEQDFIQSGLPQNPKGFRQFLTHEEKMFKFKAPRKLTDAVSEYDFLGYVGDGHPIDDKANEGNWHGRSTHRVQWMVVARLLREDGIQVIDTYKRMNGALMSLPPEWSERLTEEQRKDKQFANYPENAWHALADRRDWEKVYNATCPEYFRGIWLKQPRDGFISLSTLQVVWT